MYVAVAVYDSDLDTELTVQEACPPLIVAGLGEQVPWLTDQVTLPVGVMLPEPVAVAVKIMDEPLSTPETLTVAVA